MPIWYILYSHQCFHRYTLWYILYSHQCFHRYTVWYILYRRQCFRRTTSVILLDVRSALSLLWFQRKCHSWLFLLWFLQRSTDPKAEWPRQGSPGRVKSIKKLYTNETLTLSKQGAKHFLHTFLHVCRLHNHGRSWEKWSCLLQLRFAAEQFGC